MKRNWRIEAIRFLATSGIAIFHFEWIYFGHPIYFQHFYLWVEFFFVLSGFFLAQNTLKNHDKSIFGPLEYTKKQAIKLWYPYVIAFVFSFIVYCLINNVHGFNNIISLLFASKWEIFFWQLSGFDTSAPVINGVTAYIPALLFSSVIVYYLIKKHYALLVNIIIPILPILIYSHMVNSYGNLSQWLPYESWYTIGLLRGLAGILLGVGTYIYGTRKFIDLQSETTNFMWKVYRFFSLFIGVIAICALVFLRNHLSFSDEIIYPYILLYF